MLFLQKIVRASNGKLDALVSVVHEIRSRVGLALPNIGALLGLTRLMASERGLYPA